MIWNECCGGAKAFSAAGQLFIMVRNSYGNVSTNRLFCRCFLLYEDSNEVISNVWLCWMTLEGARLQRAA